MFGVEHFLIFCVAVAHYGLSDTPKWVKIELEKREYERKLQIEAVRRKAAEKKK